MEIADIGIILGSLVVTGALYLFRPKTRIGIFIGTVILAMVADIYFPGFQNDVTSFDSSPCPAAADVIEVGTILESDSPSIKPLPPHTDFHISHLYDHDEFGLAVNTTVPSYHEKVYNTDWRFYADINKCAIARFNNSFSGMKHANCWQDYFLVNIEDFFEQWPLEESFLKKRLGRLYRSSQSKLIGRVYLFLADKVVKAEYQLHTENDSSSMDVSVSWNGSQVGGKRNVSSKRKSDFERPVTVDYKSKQLCAKSYDNTHLTFTLDCTHENSTWVIVENGQIQFAEERLKAKTSDGLQTRFKHILEEEGFTWMILVGLRNVFVINLLLLCFCLCYSKNHIRAAIRKPTFKNHAERILNKWPGFCGNEFTKCTDLFFAEKLAVGSVIRKSESEYSLYKKLTVEQTIIEDERIEYPWWVLQVFKWCLFAWFLPIPLYYVEKSTDEEIKNSKSNELKKIIHAHKKDAESNQSSLHVVTEVLYGENCSVKHDPIPNQNQMSEGRQLTSIQNCSKIAIAFKAEPIDSDEGITLNSTAVVDIDTADKDDAGATSTGNDASGPGSNGNGTHEIKAGSSAVSTDDDASVPGSSSQTLLESDLTAGSTSISTNDGQDMTLNSTAAVDDVDDDKDDADATSTVDGTQETIASSPVGSTAKDATGPGSSSQTLPESDLTAGSTSISTNDGQDMTLNSTDAVDTDTDKDDVDADTVDDVDADKDDADATSTGGGNNPELTSSTPVPASTSYMKK